MAERCASHGLALGPDGGCVLCRREAGPRGVPAAVAGLVLVGLVLVTAIGWSLLRRSQSDAAAPAARAEQLLPSSQPRGAPPAALPRRAEIPPGELPRPEPAPATTEAEPTRVEQPTLAPAARGTASASGAAELAAALRAVRITMYSTEWCPHCTRARQWLRANNLAFTERDVEQSESARGERDRINPKGGVPTVDIDGRVLTGFGEQSWSRAIASATQKRLEQSGR